MGCRQLWCEHLGVGFIEIVFGDKGRGLVDRIGG